MDYHSVLCRLPFSELLLEHKEALQNLFCPTDYVAEDDSQNHVYVYFSQAVKQLQFDVVDGRSLSGLDSRGSSHKFVHELEFGMAARDQKIAFPRLHSGRLLLFEQSIRVSPAPYCTPGFASRQIDVVVSNSIGYGVDQMHDANLGIAIFCFHATMLYSLSKKCWKGFFRKHL